MKKAQISTEIMYAIGVMIVIFLILTGISFTRKSDLRKTNDYLKKKSECLKVADTLSMIGLSGSDTVMNITLKYTTNIYQAGTILIGETAETGQTIEASCSFIAPIAANYISVTGNKIIKVANGVINLI